MTAPSLRISLLAGLALLLATAAPALTVGRIGLADSGGRRVLSVQTRGKADPSLETLSKKLVVTIPDGQRAMKSLRVGGDLVTLIRFGKQGKDLRVVLDLTHDIKPVLGAVGASGFEVDLGPANSAVAASGKGAAAEPDDAALSPAASGYTYSIVDIALSGDAEHSEIIVTANGPASYKPSVRDNGRLISLNFRNSSLAFAGDLSKLADDSIDSVSAKQSSAGGESQVTVDVRLPKKLDYALQRDQNQLVLRLDRPEKRVESPQRGNIESKVSVEVQNADLVGILKTLCDQAGFDYQFSKDILSKTPPDSLVTIKVNDRPFREVADTLLAGIGGRFLQQGNTLFFGTTAELDEKKKRLPQVQRTYYPKYLTVKQALEVLTAQFKRDEDKSLATDVPSKDPRDPSRLLLVGTTEDVSRVLDALAHYDVPESGAAAASADDGGGGQAKTQVFHLQYLNKTQHNDLITAAIAQLYPEGETAPTPYIDDTTRNLVVTTQVKYLRKIEKLLARLDVRPNQVNIEARIIEVNQTDSNLLGVDWTSVSTKQSGLFEAGTTNSIPESQGLFNTNLTGTFPSQLTLATIQSGLGIQARIQALVDSKKAELVSSPNITVRDNQAANIGVEDTLTSVDTTTTITNGIATVASTNRTQTIPLTLQVLPRLSMVDRRVLMKITFNLTTPTGPAPSASADAPTTKQTADTEVSVNSGDTAVIGGLVRQNNITQERKVPVLGDIPLLGILFRSKAESKEKKEVVIFITPTIVEE